MTDLLTNTQAPRKLNCPTCKKVVWWNDSFPHRPFCCDRCRLIDLGEWASEGHRIAGSALNANTEADNSED
jgi:uncharacterized protein